MRYLYNYEGAICQSDSPPSSRDVELVIDGSMNIYRVNEAGEFEEMTPIDIEDTDNWTIVEVV